MSDNSDVGRSSELTACAAARARAAGAGTPAATSSDVGQTESGFDPCHAQTATTCGEAIELARAWADGRRSWTNLGHAPDVIAVMDAQEVVKWTAMAVALAQLDELRMEAMRDA